VCSLTRRPIPWGTFTDEITLAGLLERETDETVPRLPIGVQRNLYHLWTTQKKALVATLPPATH
jgi:hypothetical protein